MLGLNLSLSSNRAPPFNPSGLFLGGEAGVWYDPSDFSTMFQDTAGTTPVTAVEQPVGLMLDKSRGLVLGSELSSNVGGPYTATTGWTGNNLTPALTSGEIELTGTASGIIGGYFDINVTANVPVRIVIPVRSVSQSFSVNVYNGAFSSQITNASVTVPAGTSRTVTFTVTPTLSFIRVYVFHNSGVVTSRSAFVSSLSVKQLPGNHATQPTATSRPVLRQDGNGKHYLYFDGVDDWLVTNTITPGTDKVQVFAGVRKLSDATKYQVLLESSPIYSTNNGAFILSTSWDASQYATGSHGTYFTNCTTSPLSAPRTNVATMVSSIADDTLLLRINGTQAASSTADQGTGNYGNYPLYIGRRAGTTYPFNGHLYSLLVRFGSNLPAATIEKTEKYINTKTRAY